MCVFNKFNSTNDKNDKLEVHWVRSKNKYDIFMDKVYLLSAFPFLFVFILLRDIKMIIFANLSSVLWRLQMIF